MAKNVSRQHALVILNAILLDGQRDRVDGDKDKFLELRLLGFEELDNDAFRDFLNFEKTESFEMLDTGEDESVLNDRLENRSSEYETNFCIFKFLDVYYKLEYDYLSHSGASIEDFKMQIVQPKPKTVIYYE